LIDLDLNAYHFQFFPAPMMLRSRRAGSRERSLFFWQRRPDSKINIKTLYQLVHDWPQSRLHLHLASDERSKEPECFTEELKELRRLGHTVTTSAWFKNPGEYFSTLRNFSLFLGPRLEEGIGMSFLEPMSMGLCVIANDKPTMNEYIYHGLNGILLNFDDMSELHCSLEEREIEEIGQRAVQSITEGHARWTRDSERLCAVVEGVERARREFCEEHEMAVRRTVFDRNNG
jgi:glycosyltransferase involved in cell wall biosynthesis